MYPDSLDTIKNNRFDWNDVHRFVLCVFYVKNHFVMLEFDKVERKVLCYDGLFHSLDKVKPTVSCVFKMCSILHPEEPVDTLPSGWDVGYADDVTKQVDSTSCGPLCCYNFILKVREKNDVTPMKHSHKIRLYVVDEYLKLISKYRESISRSVTNHRQDKNISNFCCICYEKLPSEKMEMEFICHAVTESLCTKDAKKKCSNNMVYVLYARKLESYQLLIIRQI